MFAVKRRIGLWVTFRASLARLAQVGPPASRAPPRNRWRGFAPRERPMDYLDKPATSSQRA